MGGGGGGGGGEGTGGTLPEKMSALDVAFFSFSPAPANERK